MNFIKRHIGSSVRRLSEQFPVILLSGARQVGKTTILRELAEPNRELVSLDDLDERELAIRDPKLFFKLHRLPLLLDEIQYAPNLMAQIKLMVDAAPDRCGDFWMTGSQQFNLMRSVSESLAGRVAILDLGGISQQEELGNADVGRFEVESLELNSVVASDVHQVYSRILRGMYPALVSRKVNDIGAFYRAYFRTYIERDIRDLAKVADELRFVEFVKVLAARTGQMLNLSHLAQEVGISSPTAKSWLSLMETSGIVYLLRPYSGNVGLRMVKTPKFYFMDTGLASYLTGWRTVETLANGAMAGALLETFVVSELVKRAWNVGEDPGLWMFRDGNGVEIDILQERDGRLFPIEVKRTASPCANDVKAFRTVPRRGLDLSLGAVICLADRIRPITDEAVAIPIGCV